VLGGNTQVTINLSQQNGINSIDIEITTLRCPSATDVPVAFCNFAKA
jgi:hypothetical protein